MFAVLDGHGGFQAAHFCQQHLKELGESVRVGESEEKLHEHIKELCLRLDQQFTQLATRSSLQAGSTLLMALLHQDRVTVSNIGDSVGLLLKRNGQFQRVTVDQVPSRPDEYSRIIKNNGFVITKHDVVRVDGNIAVSRAIGDIQYKKYLIPEPESTSFEVSEEDDVLILSTDGLFLVYSEQ
mmetsp:Transcript_675/g.1263  ORF Transcript_675/g.1263 Transcript_675/m.1263 type:complete len:182 (-) Transcript_675:991-1536(-)